MERWNDRRQRERERKYNKTITFWCRPYTSFHGSDMPLDSELESSKLEQPHNNRILKKIYIYIYIERERERERRE